MGNNTFLLIDEGYLSYISKHFGGGKPLKNRIEKFAMKVAAEKNLNCIGIYYYTAPPYQSPKPTPEENKRRANYDRFIGKLKQVNPKIYIREGRCQKDEAGKFHQKGVDTLLTMDLLKIAQKKETDTIILLTSDTDFVPIILDIKINYKIKVFLAYFTDRKRKSGLSLSNHLWKVCDDKILVKRKHFGVN